MSSFHMVTKGIEGDIVQQDDHPFEPSGEIVSLDPIIPGLGMGNDLGIFTEKEQMNKIFGLTKVLARSDDPDDKLQFEAICGTVSDDITYVKEHRNHLRKMKTVFQEKVKMCDSGIAFDSMLEFNAKVFLENMKSISEGHEEAATTFDEALQAKKAECAAALWR